MDLPPHTEGSRLRCLWAFRPGHLGEPFPLLMLSKLHGLLRTPFPAVTLPGGVLATGGGWQHLDRVGGSSILSGRLMEPVKNPVPREGGNKGADADRVGLRHI